MRARPLDNWPRSAGPVERFRDEIARLPLTMQPALNQQVNRWNDLFPFEQKRAAEFLRGLSLLGPADFGKLTHPLRELESQMGVAHWNFSIEGDTMANASQLARSPYYSEWRREVQRVFATIEVKARDSAAAEPLPSR